MKDVSSQDIIKGLGKIPFHAQALNDRKELLKALAAAAHPGDCVLVMGARDPSLAGLAGKIIDTFGGVTGKRSGVPMQNTTLSSHPPPS